MDAALANGKVEVLGAAWKDYEARQGRTATPEEVGDVVVLLSTPRMSLVNGHNLVIDGYVSGALPFSYSYQRTMKRSSQFAGDLRSTRPYFDGVVEDIC